MFPYRQNLSLASYQSHYLHVNERHRSKRGSSQGSHCLISPIKDRRTFKGGRTRALNEAKDDEGRAGDVDEATRRGAQGNETQTKRDRKVPRAPAVDDSVEGRLKPFDVKQAGLKVAWFGAEALGNILADGTTRTDGRTSSQEKMGGGAAGSVGLSRRDAMESLKRDYDEGYFVSGSGKLDAYARDCRFADPFTSFRGVDRFKRNVSNLGAMLSDVDLQILSWEESDDSLRTSWRFSGIVDLPWHPRLAAAGSTVHVFDPETGYVVEHLESWDTEPVKVLRTLLRPSSKIPRNQVCDAPHLT